MSSELENRLRDHLHHPVDVQVEHNPARLAEVRSRVRRHNIRRGVLVGSAGATAAAVAVAAFTFLGPGTASPDGQGGTDVAGQGSSGGTATTAKDGTAAPVLSQRPLGFGEAMDVSTPESRVGDAAEEYATVVAGLLDPQGVHAVLPAANVNSRTKGGAITAVGTRLGWRQPGEDGLGQVAITVGTTVNSAQWTCDAPGWVCTDVTAPAGTSTARQATHDGDLDVMVTHTDGTVVTLATSTLFGNNSNVPVSTIGLSAVDLADAAADPRLVVPALPAPSNRLDPKEVGDVIYQTGRDNLVDPDKGETLDVTDGGYDEENRGYLWPAYSNWTGPHGSGQLKWSPDTDNPTLTKAATCVKAWFTRCVIKTINNREVFVGIERSEPGWRVWSLGIQRAITVEYTGTGYPINRAVNFVVDPKLQLDGN